MLYCDKLKVSTLSQSLFFFPLSLSPPLPVFFSLFSPLFHLLFSCRACQRGDWRVQAKYSFVITNIFLIIVIIFFVLFPLLEHACPFPFTLIWQCCLTSVGHSQTSLPWALYTCVIKRSLWLQKPAAFSFDLTALHEWLFHCAHIPPCWKQQAFT